MAIYNGTWKDGGVGFDPAAFSLQQTEVPPPDPPLAVTGNGNPSPNGDYVYGGEWLGKPYYQHPDLTFFIWHGISGYMCSPALGVGFLGAWLNGTPVVVEGTYNPVFGYSGNPEVAFLPPEPPRSWGIARLRISGRRAGSGIRAGWYPAGPGWAAGIYRQSPRQWTARQKWGHMMKWYSEIYSRPAFTVNTMNEQAHVLCVEPPAITGYYKQLFPPPSMSPWQSAAHGFTVWYHNPDNRWYLADTYPAAPGPADRYYEKLGIVWHGLYTGGGTAVGNAEITSVTFDGKYMYVGEHDGNIHYFNNFRNAHIWYSAIPNQVVLADTYPVDPGPGDLWWKPPFPWYSGEYAAQGIAEGTAIVDEP